MIEIDTDKYGINGKQSAFHNYRTKRIMVSRKERWERWDTFATALSCRVVNNLTIRKRKAFMKHESKMIIIQGLITLTIAYIFIRWLNQEVILKDSEGYLPYIRQSLEREANNIMIYTLLIVVLLTLIRVAIIEKGKNNK
ncbi:hypothetical protein GCM10011386_36360 [Parapedobacter defluvii]|uniref:Uncharacterized protein n=1 Tax=Parapedobacter defluvii TaxID=2045106 RepID=A0ABQ1MMI8_9SPHI|nr:hypothetical protein GCM10011386_36360 [Parapedobacter defluvii]